MEVVIALISLCLLGVAILVWRTYELEKRANAQRSAILDSLRLAQEALAKHLDSTHATQIQKLEGSEEALKMSLRSEIATTNVLVHESKSNTEKCFAELTYLLSKLEETLSTTLRSELTRNEQAIGGELKNLVSNIGKLETSLNDAVAL